MYKLLIPTLSPLEVFLMMLLIIFHIIIIYWLALVTTFGFRIPACLDILAILIGDIIRVGFKTWMGHLQHMLVYPKDSIR